MLEGKAQQVMSYSHSESHSGSQIHSQLPQRWLVSSWAAFSRLESSLGVSGGLRALWPNQPTAQELSGRCTGSRRALRISAQVEELLGRSTSRTKSSSARELFGRNTCMLTRLPGSSERKSQRSPRKPAGLAENRPG